MNLAVDFPIWKSKKREKLAEKKLVERMSNVELEEP